MGGGTEPRPAERSAIEDDENEVVVSAVSIWEIEIKVALGKLAVAGGELLDGVRASGFELIDISADDAVAAARLPRLHGDPFDRMLVAQAQRRGLTLVTRDPGVAAYGVPTLG